MSVSKYDAIVIGSGQAGNPLAIALAKSGKKTAIIEATHIGGCCINDGCTPTKTLVASGRVAYLARRAADYGVHFGTGGDVRIDMEKVRQRKRDIVTSFRTGSERRLKSAGVDVIMGMASFVSEKEVSVRLNSGGEQHCSSDQIFVNVGECPAVPSLAGLDEVRSKAPERILDSTSVQELGEVPGSLLVLGGGYIGLEFGQLLSRLGSKVTVVQRASRLLPREDAEITASLEKILEEDGIKVLTSHESVKISLSDKDQISMVVRSKAGEQTIEGTHVLLAAGRRANTDTLKPEKANISMDRRGYIQTNDKLETNVGGVYALGDVRGPPAFTHISYDDFRILRDTLGLSGVPKTTALGQSTASHSVKARDGLVPYCCYTDPQLGHIGLHLHEIPAERHKKVKVASMPMSYVARALETDETRGMMKAIVDAETGLILGFTCLGIEGGELMSAVQLAMMGGLKWWQLQEAVFAHPAIAESLNNLWGFLKDVE
jgi:pyruvate/2-oxoglutarate dehydrogenase complex dihydrolipoamide dehydrogenase (E3) component